jgi:UV DNA damage repair endonuclease
LAELLDRGFKKQKLRAHSDFMWNDAVSDWALTFLDQWDIQVEAKGKNLASEQLYQQSLKNAR